MMFSKVFSPHFQISFFFFARHFLGTSTLIVLSGMIFSIQSSPAMSALCLWIGMEKAALGSGSRSMAVLTVSNVLWKLVDFCHLHLISNFIILNYFSCFLLTVNCHVSLHKKHIKLVIFLNTYLHFYTNTHIRIH